MEVVSFDVFDTLLTRTFACPRDLFLALGRAAAGRGLLELGAKEFAERRVLAETQAQQLAAGHAPRLRGIYSVLQQQLGLAHDQAQALLALELQMEEAALRPVPGLRERVAEARAKTGAIWFITDMYLPGAFIERLLAIHGFFQPGDRVYVSGEQGASKAGGELFRRLAAEHQVRSGGWSHEGDSPEGDYRAPREVGLHARLRPGARLSRYELLARGRAPWAPEWRSRLGAAMRLARLESVGVPDAAKRVIWCTGADVVGPLLFGYVHWCLQEATQRGLRRLYFVARDGQVLHKLATQLCSAWKLDVDCRYIYGSRQAWRIPALNGVGAAELEWMLPRHHDLSARHALARVGLEPEALRDFLCQGGFAPERWDRPLTEPEIGRLRELALMAPVQDAVQAAARRTRPALIAYLKQEGLLEGVPFGLVDLGWEGNLQKSLARLLALAGHAGAARLKGFYFGLRRSTVIPPDQELVCYLPPDVGVELDSRVTMLEMFTAADHGSTAAFELKGDTVVPALICPVNAPALGWGLAELQAAALAFAAHFLGILSDRSLPGSEWRQVTLALFEAFYQQPSRAEALAWGAFPLEGQPIENVRGQMVPDWTRWQTLAALLDYRKRPAAWWLEGTLAAKPSLLLWLFYQARRLRRSLGKKRLTTKTAGELRASGAAGLL